MALFLVRGKYGNAAFKGTVDSPQDREAAAHKNFLLQLGSICKMSISVWAPKIVAIAEGSAESMAAVEMVTMSTGTFTSFEGIEIIDSKSMTAAMETANKVVSAYQAPNK